MKNAIGFTAGMTGNRYCCSDEQLKVAKEILQKMKPDALVHGDCLGADKEISELADSLGISIYTRPCDIPNMRAHCKGTQLAEPKHPLERNKDIVNQADFMLAFPKEFEEQQRSGTWSTIRYAIKVGCPLIIIYPDGTTERTDIE